jgi:HEAT repeat protein
MFKTSPWFSIVFTAVMIGNGFVPTAVASEWNSQKGIRDAEARSKDSLRYFGRYPMLLTQAGTNAQSASDLIPFLLDDSAEIREKAFNDLSQLGVDVAVPALTGALQNPDWQVRVISAYSLGRLGPEASSAVPVLINALQDGNVDVRFSAAQALGKINADQAVSPLINALKDADENVRFAAASALLQLGKKVQYDNIRILNRFLKNGNPMPVYSKFAIVDTLKPESRLGLSNYAESLGASNWFLRNQSADILVKLKLGSIPPLSNTIWIGVDGNQSEEESKGSSGFVRGVFTNTFLNTNFDGLIEILKTSENTEIRQQAAKILGMLGNAEAIPYLIDSLQKETLNWIGAIKNEQKVLRDNPQNEEAMTEASSKASDSPDATQKIITSLGRLKSKESIPVILETWQKINAIQPDKDHIEDLRDCIQDSLEKIGSQEAISALSKTFPEDAKSFTASDSIRKITKGETNSQESIVLLKSILHSGNIDAISKVINPSELANNSSDYVSALTISFQQLGVEKSVSILKPILLVDNDGSDLTYNRLAAAKYLSLLGSGVVPVIVKSFSEAEAIGHWYRLSKSAKTDSIGLRGNEKIIQD